ncbi:LPXTG cell wall anchor domain-containing protein [Schaalia vaccimaxillae]|uniref:LPXTG cell wall anchor domain-containing protein n=1 Tax=Schaalia vaccimaxillae TaxID=183916 RepID=UPI0003B4CCEB|nr:LPXTG cell wall anchor domain-containing protein [Schaalia vaccimaxillae]
MQVQHHAQRPPSRRSKSSLAFSIIAALAMVVTSIVGVGSVSPAKAEEPTLDECLINNGAQAQPADLTSELTNPTVVTNPEVITEGTTVTSTIGLTLPLKAKVGDYFTVTLPKEFTQWPPEIYLSDPNDSSIRFGVGSITQAADGTWAARIELTEAFRAIQCNTNRVNIEAAGFLRVAANEVRTIPLTYEINGTPITVEIEKQPKFVGPRNRPTEVVKSGWFTEQGQQCRTTNEEDLKGCLVWYLQMPVLELDSDPRSAVIVLDEPAGEGWKWECNDASNRLTIHSFKDGEQHSNAHHISEYNNDFNNAILTNHDVTRSATVTSYSCAPDQLSITVDASNMSATEDVLTLSWAATPDAPAPAGRTPFSNTAKITIDGTEFTRNYDVIASSIDGRVDSTSIAVAKGDDDYTGDGTEHRAADAEDTASVLKDTDGDGVAETDIVISVTNKGNTNLTDIAVSDLTLTTSQSGELTSLTCDFTPYGGEEETDTTRDTTVTKDGINYQVLQVKGGAASVPGGEVINCKGRLEGVLPDKMHADLIQVTAAGDLYGENPYHATYTRFSVAKTITDNSPFVFTSDEPATIERTYKVTTKNEGLSDGTTAPVYDVPTIPTGFTVTLVTVDGVAVEADDQGHYLVSEGDALAVGQTKEHTVVVSFLADPRAIGRNTEKHTWADLEACVEGGKDEPVDSAKGIYNLVTMAGDTDADQHFNNDACFPVLPPPPAVDIEKFDVDGDLTDDANGLGYKVGHDADTAEEAVEVEVTPVALKVPVQNTGSIDLIDITISDRNITGPDNAKVTSLTCDFTEFGGPVATDTADINDSSDWVSVKGGAAVLKPGDIVMCDAVLEGVNAIVHGNRMSVTALGAVGYTPSDDPNTPPTPTTPPTPVEDEDDYHAKTSGFKVAKSTQDGGDSITEAGKTTLTKTYTLTVTNTGAGQGKSAPVYDTPIAPEGVTVQSVTIDGKTVESTFYTTTTGVRDEGYLVSEGVILDAGQSQDFTVQITYLLDADKVNAAGSWPALAKCTPGGNADDDEEGLYNLVSMEGDEDGPGNNDVCTPVTPQPKIDIEKLDVNGNDADIRDEAVNLTATKGEIRLDVPVTNNGPIPLTNLVISDANLDYSKSGQVQTLRCDFTGLKDGAGNSGTVISDDLADGKISISAGALVLPVGQTINCEALLTGVTQDIHANRMSVVADGIIGWDGSTPVLFDKPVTDEDDYHANTVVEPAGPGKKKLAKTGSDAAVLLAGAMGTAVAGTGLMLAGKRRRKEQD